MDTPSRARARARDLDFNLPARVEDALSADDLAASAGITLAALSHMVALDLIEPLTPGSNRFSATTAARLHRMVRIHAGLGVNLMGAAIIVDLLERMERMESEMRGGAR